MTQAFVDFLDWFVDAVPTFLLSHPIVDILGICFFALVVGIVARLFRS